MKAQNDHIHELRVEHVFQWETADENENDSLLLPVPFL